MVYYEGRATLICRAKAAVCICTEAVGPWPDFCILHTGNRIATAQSLEFALGQPHISAFSGVIYLPSPSRLIDHLTPSPNWILSIDAYGGNRADINHRENVRA